MNLIKKYILVLKKDHNLDYYQYNTFPIRFLKSQTNIKEIFIIFCNDGFVLLMLIYQINILYKIDLYFFFIFWFFYYLLGLSKFLLKKYKKTL